jgi:biotin transport system ATP-binding protein
MPETTLFSLRGVTKHFPGAEGTAPFIALDNIDLDIFEGQCLLIAGSNGSGKTLLMQIAAGLLEPSGGEALFRGMPLYGKKRKRETERSLRKELGLVFQDADAQIVGETAAEDCAFGPENLGMSPAEVKARVDGALDCMGLAEKRESSPRRLSGGEKRRLAIAGVLAMGCNTIIMDEPFANLDWHGVVQTLGVIRGLKGSGKTLIILTHELEKALAFADRLVIIHRGRVRGDGPPEVVLNRLDLAWGVRDPRRNYAAVRDCTWLEN